MTLKIETLKTFVEVARRGSLMTAAAHLGRTPSAVSMTLKMLEGHLGQKLFEGERKDALSPFGKDVFDLALKQTQQFDAMVDAIEARAASNSGLVRISSIPSAAAFVFPKMLDQLLSEFPGVKLDLRDADSHHVRDALRNGIADIGIASGSEEIYGLERIQLYRDQFGLVLSKKHPLFGADRLPTIEQVFAQPFVRTELCDLIETTRVRLLAEKAPVTIRNTQSIVALIQTGRWVSLLPQSVLNFLPDECAFMKIANFEDVRDVSMYVRPDTQFAKLTARCAQLLEANYR